VPISARVTTFFLAYRLGPRLRFGSLGLFLALLGLRLALLLYWLRLLLVRRLALRFLLCGLGFLFWFLVIRLRLFLSCRLRLFFLFRRLRLMLLLGGLGLFFVLRRFSAFVVMIVLREGRNSRSEDQEQCCCADDSKYLHVCCLHCVNSCALRADAIGLAHVPTCMWESE